MFVAAHRFSGGAVDMGEAVDPTPHQHPVHGRGSDTDPVGDLDRAQALLPAQVHDPAHHRCRRRPRPVVRPAGAIGHAGRAVEAVAVGPAFRGRPGHLEPGSGRSDRHVALDDQTRQAQSAAFGQWSVSVDHEDLLWLWVRVPSTAPHPPQEVLTLQDQLDRVVTRVRPTSPVSTASDGAERSGHSDQGIRLRRCCDRVVLTSEGPGAAMRRPATDHCSRSLGAPGHSAHPHRPTPRCSTRRRGCRVATSRLEQADSADSAVWSFNHGYCRGRLELAVSAAARTTWKCVLPRNRTGRTMRPSDRLYTRTRETCCGVRAVARRHRPRASPQRAGSRCVSITMTPANRVHR